jgi:hypothetical protein
MNGPFIVAYLISETLHQWLDLEDYDLYIIMFLDIWANLHRKLSFENNNYDILCLITIKYYMKNS